MATASLNRPWNLEAFLDSLIVELDKARDTLAVKAVTRPLTYSVQDVDLQLQIFPQFDGEQVKFVTAQPGQQGASGLKIQLGSITARSIKETAPEPITRDDVSIESLDDIDEEAKASLRKLGIKSGRDLERMEERDVDLEKATNKKLDYGNLASIINKARRRQVAPSVSKVGVSKVQGAPVLNVRGENLVIGHSVPEFPIALLNGERVEVLAANDRDIQLRVDPSTLAGRANKLEIALDPFAVVAMELNA
jgi:hypothetical protein